ncbi:MAG: excisionase [Candidatus Omnitrophica bacterium CG_4_10_14_0_2_um_filter_44_9]|nr:MAG: excisionase [Candidatus Omnitrophica bacterium CG_4_10_14_0_2_um_filter_44_9]
MKKLLRMEDIEEILGIPRRTYYRWEEAGKVPKAKRNPMSNQRYWTAEDIAKLKKLTGRG